MQQGLNFCNCIFQSGKAYVFSNFFKFEAQQSKIKKVELI